MIYYECGRGHRSITGGTCYQDGCYSHFSPMEVRSTRSVARNVNDNIGTLNLVVYVDRAKAHFSKTAPEGTDEYGED